MSFVEVSEWAVECDEAGCDGRLTCPDGPDETGIEVRLPVPVLDAVVLKLLDGRGWLVTPDRIVCPQCASDEGARVLAELAAELQVMGGDRDEY
ncbi:hypothetical protein [Streptomyces sp. NPDC001404]|uniref:hypothetical protein n=1 Tax=Streptomyces sp. NPDC001404 TaxID=3364571 RepID=UPI0036CD6ADF